MVFSAGNLQTVSKFCTKDIDAVCARYGFDAEVTARELTSFSVLFRENRHLIDMKYVARSQSTDDAWVKNTFLQPLRLLHQLSGFPNLLTIYKVLVTLAVSTATAERTMSKVKLIKTRLRSAMSDDFFSSLMLVACEKDIVDSLDTDMIVDYFAASSPVLRKYLVCC
jgi:hypothetical protein